MVVWCRVGRCNELSQAETVEEKRAAVQDMRSEVLAELYQEKTPM